MTVLSRLTTGGLSLASKQSPLALIPARHGGGHGYRVRPGVFAFNRAKDAMHFYLFGLCILPVGSFALITYIVRGPCELTDFPETGDYPRYWQFERSPTRQLTSRYLSPSDVAYHERQMGYHYYETEKFTFRKITNRVKHLMSERMDYKGYNYVPVKQDWIDRAQGAYDELNEGGDRFLRHRPPSI